MAKTEIVSPLPGTFYRRPSPDKPPYKEVGDSVAKGDIVGLIEVMKTFNEVKAEADGKVDAVLRRERGRRAGRPAAGRARRLRPPRAHGDPETSDCQSRRDRRAHRPRGARAGHRTVQAHSQADADSLAVQLADEAVEIGPPQASKSYLNVGAILEAARATGADAVHPGYGFLAENAAFADAVEAAGLVFVGPTGDTIRLMGDKVAARQVAAEAGVPTVPGSDGRIDDPAEAQRGHRAHRLSGDDQGGGRGRRARHPRRARRGRVRTPLPAGERRGEGRLRRRRPLCREADRAGPAHRGAGARRRDDVVHCFERECSLQRRRQKVWEEAPSADLAAGGARAACASAAGARQVGALSRRRHDRISLTTMRRARVLLPGNEHPHPGRAPGDGIGHRHRPGRRDDPDRRRREAAAAASRHRMPRPCDRGADLRRGPGERLHARARASSTN